MAKREFKLIGSVDDSSMLIYQIEPYLFAYINVEDYDGTNGEDVIRLTQNWLSPMRMCDTGIMFFETSPYDQAARKIISENMDYIEKEIEIVKSWGKPDRGLIREMANVKKYAKPNEITYW